MKTTYLKMAATSLLIMLAVLLKTNPATAQQEDKIIETQNDQIVTQRNQYNDQSRQQGEQRKKQFDQQKQHSDQHKNIEAQRIAFITQKLELTPDEAKVFWPVYNEYDVKRHELKKSFKNGDDFNKQGMDKLTEAEASQILDNQIIEAQKFLDLRKEYHAKFKSVLPAVKVLKLYDAEREFQKMLMDKIRQHKQNPVPSDKK